MEEENTPNTAQTENMVEMGTAEIPQVKSPIHCITIIGQIEGHQLLPSQNKTTQYEHVLPMLVAVEESAEIQGLLIMMNTVGGDVEAGLAIAETIATMKKPVVSLVLGGGHSIGVPLAVAARHSFITLTATMTLHPIRMNGMIIGVPQTYEYFNKMQEHISTFIVEHANITKQALDSLIMRTGEIANDVGTILVGKQAVEHGIIREVGGLKDAIEKLKQFIALG